MLRFIRAKAVDLTDAELLTRYRQTGDQDWLARLYDRYLELSYGLCLRYLREPTRAEDAVMAIFAELVTKTRQHDIGNFRNWLHSVVRNYCLMQLRQQQRLPTDELVVERMQLSEEMHPLEVDTTEAALSQLEDCLQTLVAEQQHCIRLFYLESHSYKHIAELLQLELGRVRSHIQNGRRNLRNCMESKSERQLP